MPKGKGAATASPANASPKGGPAREFRLGRIKATLWRNDHAEKGVWYSVQITRSYKDGQNQWQSSTSYGRDDLPLVMAVARMAHEWIYLEGYNHHPPSGGDHPLDDPPLPEV